MVEETRKELEAEFEQHKDYIVKLLEYKGLVARGHVNFDTIDTVLVNILESASVGRYEMCEPTPTGYMGDGTLL